MDLQHKLASLSMANNNASAAASHMQQQQQQQSYSPDATQQLPSPTSSTKERTPSLDHLIYPTVVDQVDQAAESNRPAQQQQRKVLPSTIDIHDLHSELSKLHSQGTGHPPALLKAKEPENKVNPTTTEASAVAPAATNPVAQSKTTASHGPDVVDDHPQTPTEQQPQPSFKGIPVTVPVALIPVAPVTAPTAPVAAAPAIATATTTKEQKSSQTEPQMIVAQQPLQRKLSLPPPAPPGGRRISRFCVSLVDEQQRAAAAPAASAVMDDANKDPELRELLLRHEQEKKALIRKHEEELASFHARRKQQQPTAPQQPHPHPQPALQRQEATESPRTSSPIARSSPDHTEGRGVPIPATAGGAAGPVTNATPGSSPGTPTRQTKTFTDDLLRLVQDLGSKPGAEKSKKAGGEGVEKAPTLNQLRAGANGGAVANLQQQQQQQQQQHHSLTQTAGIFTTPPT